MRKLPLAMIGTLNWADCQWLHMADAAQLFCSAILDADGLRNGTADRAAIQRIFSRVHDLERPESGPKLLKFERRPRRLTTLDRSLAPLAAWAAGLPDLIRRIAIALHVAVWAAGDAPEVPGIISVDTTTAAVALVRHFILPMSESSSCQSVSTP